MIKKYMVINQIIEERKIREPRKDKNGLINFVGVDLVLANFCNLGVSYILERQRKKRWFLFVWKAKCSPRISRKE